MAYKSSRMERDRKRYVFRRRKVCKFCENKINYIDYKNVQMLLPYIPERGKILPKRISGVCSKHQRMLSKAIKRARHIALIPYTTD
jgi:small subunit ribosomal protein S18